MVVKLDPKWPRHRISVETYHRMIASGALSENDRIELMHGELVDKMPIGQPHAYAVNTLNLFLSEGLRRRALVQVQNPVGIGNSEPEIDVSLIKPRQDRYFTALPTAADVLTAIEVAESSLEYDRSVKGPLYARAGIADYWIVNLVDEVVEIYRDPRPDGTWGHTESRGRDQSLSPLAFPDLVVPVSELLGPGRAEGIGRDS